MRPRRRIVSDSGLLRASQRAPAIQPSAQTTTLARIKGSSDPRTSANSGAKTAKLSALWASVASAATPKPPPLCGASTGCAESSSRARRAPRQIGITPR